MTQRTDPRFSSRTTSQEQNALPRLTEQVRLGMLRAQPTSPLRFPYPGGRKSRLPFGPRKENEKSWDPMTAKLLIQNPVIDPHKQYVPPASYPTHPPWKLLGPWRPYNPRTPLAGSVRSTGGRSSNSSRPLFGTSTSTASSTQQRPSSQRQRHPRTRQSTPTSDRGSHNEEPIRNWPNPKFPCRYKKHPSTYLSLTLAPELLDEVDIRKLNLLDGNYVARLDRYAGITHSPQKKYIADVLVVNDQTYWHHLDTLQHHNCAMLRDQAILMQLPLNTHQHYTVDYMQWLIADTKARQAVEKFNQKLKDEQLLKDAERAEELRKKRHSERAKKAREAEGLSERGSNNLPTEGLRRRARSQVENAEEGEITYEPERKLPATKKRPREESKNEEDTPPQKKSRPTNESASASSTTERKLPEKKNIPTNEIPQTKSKAPRRTKISTAAPTKQSRSKEKDAKDTSNNDKNHEGDAQEPKPTSKATESSKRKRPDRDGDEEEQQDDEAPKRKKTKPTRQGSQCESKPKGGRRKSTSLLREMEKSNLIMH